MHLSGLLFLALLAACNGTTAQAQSGPGAPPATLPAGSVDLQAALSQYDIVRLALVEDRDADAVTAASAMAVSVAADPDLASAAVRVASAADLETRRTAFGELSRQLVTRVASASGVRAVVYFCPMVTQGYGYWLQSAKGIGNPYMGVRMPKCGEESSISTAHKAARG